MGTCLRYIIAQTTHLRVGLALVVVHERFAQRFDDGPARQHAFLAHQRQQHGVVLRRQRDTGPVRRQHGTLSVSSCAPLTVTQLPSGSTTQVASGSKLS